MDVCPTGPHPAFAEATVSGLDRLAAGDARFLMHSHQSTRCGSVQGGIWSDRAKDLATFDLCQWGKFLNGPD